MWIYAFAPIRFLDVRQYISWRIKVSYIQKIFELNPRLARYFNNNPFPIELNFQIQSSREITRRVAEKLCYVSDELMNYLEEEAESFTRRYQEHQIKLIEKQELSNNDLAETPRGNAM